MINNKALLSKKEFIKATSLVAMPDISLDPEEADKFIDYIVDQSFWNKNARIIKMAKNEKNIRFSGYDTTKRFLKPASTFASSDYVKTFTEGKMTLSSKKLRGAVVIYDSDLEDNIEGQAFADHLMRIIATRVANELDEIYYVSNTSGYTATDARGEFNGFRYHLLHGDPSDSGTLPNAATELDASSTGDFTNVGKIAVQSTGAPYQWEFKFAKMLSSLPSKYKVKGLGNLRFYCNDIVASDYIEALSQRGTVMGDNAILGKTPLNFGTIPIATIPLLFLSKSSILPSNTSIISLSVDTCCLTFDGSRLSSSLTWLSNRSLVYRWI